MEGEQKKFPIYFSFPRAHFPGNQTRKKNAGYLAAKRDRFHTDGNRIARICHFPSSLSK